MERRGLRSGDDCGKEFARTRRSKLDKSGTSSRFFSLCVLWISISRVLTGPAFLFLGKY